MQAVVIAAGESKRFWPLNNGIHKSQFKLLGKPLIYWTLKGLAENGIQDVAIVVGKNSVMQEMLDRENDLGLKITYIIQEEPLGTGNALWQAKDWAKGPFIVLWPYKVNSKESVGRILEECGRSQGGEFSPQIQVSGMASTITTTPWEYGIAQFDGNKIVRIIENPEKGQEPSNIKVSGTCLLQPEFFSCYKDVKHHEADFIEALNVYLKDKDVVDVRLEKDTPTLKYPWDLFGIMDYLLTSPEPVISPTAKIGKNVVIDGPVYIGDNCVIGHHNVLRGPVNLEANCKTGAFMEIKRSIVQEGTIFHSGYTGDSVIGKNCRFGAEFVTGNLRLDKQSIHGLPKLGAIVGDNSIFGIHSGTMPGVLIGANCKVGPATHVFETLENDTTFYSKFDFVKKH